MINKLFSLENRIALVTGATGYLGKSISIALAGAGAHVIINGRDATKVKDLEEELSNKGYKVKGLSFDVTSDTEVENSIKYIENKLGQLDILVNNAYCGRGGTFKQSTVNDFTSSYEITVIAAFRLIQVSLPLLKKAAQVNKTNASVINIASMYGVVSPDPSIYGNRGANNPPYYGAAKAALIQLTRYASCHLAGDQVRVNSISPGPFPKPDISIDSPSFYKELCKKNPLHRIGYAEELKGPVIFLASDASSFVTGANLIVDGGWTAW